MVLRQARHRQPAQNSISTPAISHGVSCEFGILQPIEHQRPPYDVTSGRLVRLSGGSQFHSPYDLIAPSNSPANLTIRPLTRSRTRKGRTDRSLATADRNVSRICAVPVRLPSSQRRTRAHPLRYLHHSADGRGLRTGTELEPHPPGSKLHKTYVLKPRCGWRVTKKAHSHSTSLPPPRTSSLASRDLPRFPARRMYQIRLPIRP